MRFLHVLVVGLVLTGCAEETPVYTVDFTTDVVVDSCSSVHISSTVVVQEGATLDQKGIIVSVCNDPELTDPERESNDCNEIPDVYVTDSSSTSYSFTVSNILNGGMGYPMFEPGKYYYTRSFVVIKNRPYYGDVVEFSCQ